jgi:hypothetical protein
MRLLQFVASLLAVPHVSIVHMCTSDTQCAAMVEVDKFVKNIDDRSSTRGLLLLGPPSFEDVTLRTRQGRQVVHTHDASALEFKSKVVIVSCKCCSELPANLVHKLKTRVHVDCVPPLKIYEIDGHIVAGR